MKRRAFDNKRDANEKAIVAALEQAGAKVWRLDQPWDLLICISKRYYMAECKSKGGFFTPEQIKRALDWPVGILRTPEEAIAFVNSIRRLEA